jgi:carboxyl-terminal processing protease
MRSRRWVLLLLLVLATSGSAQDRAALTAEEALKSFDEAWTLVRDRHFDPRMNGVDWSAVRTELRPRAAQARTLDELREVIREMIGRLGQSHFYVIPRETVEAFDPDLLAGTGAAPEAAATAMSGDIGLDLRLVEGRALVTRLDQEGPAAAAGVGLGWTITALDGFDVAGFIASIPADLEARRASLRVWSTLSARLRGRPGSTLQVACLDGADRPVTKTVARRAEPGAPAKFGNLPPTVARVESAQLRAADRVSAGLIRFNVWMMPIVAEVDAAVHRFRDADGIVIDLRGNPGGIAGIIMGLAGHFLDDRISLGTMTMRDGELRFIANPRRVAPDGARVAPYGGPVAILVDSLSHSASEVFAGGMQSIGRARVFGERTAGGVLPALFQRLPTGDVLGHAFADFQTPAGVRLEGRGVVPDEPAAHTRASLLAGRDAALDAALRWIAGRASARAPANDDSDLPRRHQPS